MLRKILLALLLLVLLVVGGGFALLTLKSDLIINKFNDYVTESTGAPLRTESPPKLTLLPNRGLELGAGTWERADGSLAIGFSRASVQISSHALFSGEFRIKNFSVDDLSVMLRTDSSLWQHARSLQKAVGQRAPDETVRLILRALQLAPDNITIRRGQIRLIQPDGTLVLLSPFSLSASNVHPGSDTDFSLRTHISGEKPNFAALLNVRCTALFSREKAAFTIAEAKLMPEEGLPFAEPLTLSGGLEYDFATSGLTLSQLHFQGPELSVTSSGSIASLVRLYQNPQQADAALTLQLRGNPKRLAHILNRPLPIAEEECFDNVDISAQLRWANNLLYMDTIQGKADELTFSGKFTTPLPNFDVNGELAFGKVHLVSYRNKAANTHGPRAAQRDFSRWPRVNLNITADEVTWKKLTLRQVRARMVGQNGTYEFNPLSGNLLGSPMTASLMARMLPSSPLSALISMRISLPQTDIAKLCRIVMEHPLVTGVGALNASMSFNSIRGLYSLNGQGSFTSSKAQTSLSLLPANFPGGDFLSQSGDLQRLFCSFGLQGGIMTMKNFSLEAPRLSLKCSGSLDLPERTIDAGGTLRVSGSAAFPVRIQGALASPSYLLDLPSSSEGGSAKRVN